MVRELVGFLEVSSKSLDCDDHVIEMGDDYAEIFVTME